MVRNLAPMRLRARRDRGIVEAFVKVVAVMRRQDALEILEAKLAAVEQDHQTELEANEELRDSVDARAEARALTAVLDCLQNCKVAPTESLLRRLEPLAPAAPAVSRMIGARSVEFWPIE